MEQESELRRLPVDLEEIILLASMGEHPDAEYQSYGYVDTHTGAVHSVLADAFRYLEGDLDEESLSEEARAELPLAEAILESLEQRYIRIVPLDSRESFDVMEDFAERCQDARVRTALLGVLRQNRPFRRFKDLVSQWPDLREVWHAFKDRHEREQVREWLRRYGVDAEDASIHKPAPLPDTW